MTLDFNVPSPNHNNISFKNITEEIIRFIGNNESKTFFTCRYNGRNRFKFDGIKNLKIREGNIITCGLYQDFFCLIYSND